MPIKRHDVYDCPCGKAYTPEQLTFLVGTYNANRCNEHSLTLAPIEDNIAEGLDWELQGDIETDIHFIVAGECCEGDYIIVGSDMNDEHVAWALTQVMIEHDAMHQHSFDDIIKAARKFIAEHELHFKLVHWGTFPKK